MYLSPSSSNAFSSSCACNGAASEPPNPFGHVALAITGEGVWSYGTMHPLGSSVIAYIKEQETKRNQRIYPIPATPEQDAAALNYLKSLPPGEMEGVRTDNCSTRTSTALFEAGFDYPPIFPPGWFWSHFFDPPITTFAPPVIMTSVPRDSEFIGWWNSNGPNSSLVIPKNNTTLPWGDNHVMNYLFGEFEPRR
jgi:hypothetical protein